MNRCFLLTYMLYTATIRYVLTTKVQMNRAQRLEAIKGILEEATSPVSGSYLAELFGVSRQTIVQDVALLRNQGFEIVSTPSGYFLDKVKKIREIIAVRHTKEEVFDELLAIVEAGGKVLDVMIDHPLYGSLKAALELLQRKK